ncbi:MAG TPA: MFS transporter [Anaeromyxobacteraceae bacterium]|nr:MFS transporter [Anaeromyxobacteraceae bacterium]
MATSAKKLGTTQSFRTAFSSWRLAAVSLLSFSSGLPLGLVLTAIPFWMQQRGVDIRSIGLVTLGQAPYTFKFLWSPLMDRFAPRRGRKRAWILVGQLLLAGTVASLALYAQRPAVGAITLLALIITFSSATQDIAIDAYTVEVLRTDEQGLAVGARVALYRAAMYVSGAVLITAGPFLGWGPCYVALGAMFLLLVPVTLFAPEPEFAQPAPRSLRAAVWEPLVSFFRHPQALEIAGFLFFYKLSNNVAEALVRPFLGQLGYRPFDVGIATGTVSLGCTLLGTFVGGIACISWGVGRALWVFGFVQALAHGGYAVVAQLGVNRPVMYAAMALEAGAIGLGTGAFNVLLLRLTQKRFSATQYALFSSIFALNRTVAGPPAGVLIDALGWRDFFLVTIPMALPGLVMLQRFVPLTAREVPELPDEGISGAGALVGRPLTVASLFVRGIVATAASSVLFYLAMAVLGALRAMRTHQGNFDLLRASWALFHPAGSGDYLDLAGPAVAGLVVGLAWSAYLFARHGLARSAVRAH